MWWRFIIFCFLVSFILVIVLNYLHDRPVVHFKFFKRCCDDGNENDHVVFEKFKDNFLKERLVAFEFEADNGTFVPEDVDIEEVIEVMREKLNVHDPNSRRIVESFDELLNKTETNGIQTHNLKKNFEKVYKEFSDDILDENDIIDIEEDDLDVFELSNVANTKKIDENMLSNKSIMKNVTKSDVSNENEIENATSNMEAKESSKKPQLAISLPSEVRNNTSDKESSEIARINRTVTSDKETKARKLSSTEPWENEVSR